MKWYSFYLGKELDECRNELKNASPLFSFYKRGKNEYVSDFALETENQSHRLILSGLEEISKENRTLKLIKKELEFTPKSLLALNNVRSDSPLKLLINHFNTIKMPYCLSCMSTNLKERVLLGSNHLGSGHKLIYVDYDFLPSMKQKAIKTF